MEADGGKWPTLNNSYLLRVQFYQNPQAGIPQAIVLKVTDLGVQRPLLYSCHLYEYADGRQNGTVVLTINRIVSPKGPI